METKYKRRHRVLYRLIRWLVALPLRRYFSYSYTAQALPEGPCLVVSNHVSDVDPAFVGLALDGHMYFVASEHVSRMGWRSSLLRFTFAPITRVKGKTDARSGMEILRALRRGQAVCMFAEGNRSFSGLTGPVHPATGGLVRAAGASLLTFRLEGGYFAAPRWGSRMRKGPIRGGVVGLYRADTLKAMTAEEINGLIARDIAEDAYARQLEAPAAYRCKAPAEHLETALFLCPACGGLSTLTSQGDRLSCTCGLALRYTELGMLEAAEGSAPPPFTTVRDWFTWQAGQVPGLVEGAGDGLLCRDEGLALYQVQSGRFATLSATGSLELWHDRLVCAGQSFPLGDIAQLAIVGRQTLTFMTRQGVQYEIKSHMPYSAVKYQLLLERLASTKTGT